MKKSLLALAALTAFTGLASAQSSVTLFGVVDLAGRNVKNGSAGDRYNLANDGNSSSRLGFRGVEDLGGGLRAGFWLEAGLNASQGTVGGSNGGATVADAFFNRRSTVSLLGGWGELRLGRDYVPTFWNHTVFDPFGTNGVGSANNIVGQAFGAAGAQTYVRANNAIGYFLPAIGGLYGQIMVTAGENQTPGNKYFGGRIGYAAGPFNVAGAWGTTEQHPGMTGDLDEWNIGGSFNFGFMTLMGQWTTIEEGPRNKQENFLIGMTFPIGAGTIKASYAETDWNLTSFTGSRKANQFAVGYVYDLSKRTAVYAHYAVVDNDTGLALQAGAGGPPVGTLTGFKSTGYEFGLRHSF